MTSSAAIPPARKAPPRDAVSIGLYLAVAFVMAWSLWALCWLATKNVLHDFPLIPMLIVGSFAPFVGAGICAWRDAGFAGMLRFYARSFEIRMGWTVFLLSFFLLPLLAMAGEQIHAWMAHRHFVFTMTWSEAPGAYVWLFFLGGAVAEEFGWSYLSDRLDQFLPLTRSTFVLGAIWAVWHLPLFYIVVDGLAQSFTPFYLFFICTVTLRFLFAWTYHRSGGNILSNILFHNASNMGYSVVALAPTATDSSVTTFVAFIAMTMICAAGLWIFAPVRAMPVPARA